MLMVSTVHPGTLAEGLSTVAYYSPLASVTDPPPRELGRKTIGGEIFAFPIQTHVNIPLGKLRYLL